LTGSEERRCAHASGLVSRADAFADAFASMNDAAEKKRRAHFLPPSIKKK